jgi:hypothetical protein
MVTAIAVVFIPSRLFLLQYGRPAGTDTELFARFAYVRRLAAERRAPFHDVYRRMGLATFNKHDGVPPPFVSAPLTVVEYPPLAVAVVTIPSLAVLQGGPVSRMSLPEFTARYVKAYRWFCAAVEMIAVAVASLLLFILYRNENAVATALRMCILCCAGLCMPRILYDRLDLIMGALVILSLAALRRRLRLLSFFILALAANFKLIPLVLLPILVFGSFKASDFQQPSVRERLFTLLRLFTARSLILCGMTVGIFLVFYLIEGKGVFDFFKYHGERGVHIESTWGTVALLTARLFGAPFKVVYDHGAFNADTPIAHFLLQWSSPSLAAVVAAVTLLLAIRCGRKLARPAGGETFLLEPQSAVEASLLFLCVVFSFSKVFSPQFLLALVPLVALLPFTGRGAFVYLCVFIGTCCLSTLIYPYFYTRAILSGPVAFGCFLLAARTLLLLGMTGILLVRVFTRGSGSDRLCAVAGGGAAS